MDSKEDNNSDRPKSIFHLLRNSLKKGFSSSSKHTKVKDIEIQDEVDFKENGAEKNGFLKSDTSQDNNITSTSVSTSLKEYLPEHSLDLNLDSNLNGGIQETLLFIPPLKSAESQKEGVEGLEVEKKEEEEKDVRIEEDVKIEEKEVKDVRIEEEEEEEEEDVKIEEKEVKDVRIEEEKDTKIEEQEKDVRIEEQEKDVSEEQEKDGNIEEEEDEEEGGGGGEEEEEEEEDVVIIEEKEVQQIEVEESTINHSSNDENVAENGNSQSEKELRHVDTNAEENDEQKSNRSGTGEKPLSLLSYIQSSSTMLDNKQGPYAASELHNEKPDMSTNVYSSAESSSHVGKHESTWSEGDEVLSNENDKISSLPPPPPTASPSHSPYFEEKQFVEEREELRQENNNSSVPLSSPSLPFSVSSSPSNSKIQAKDNTSMEVTLDSKNNDINHIESKQEVLDGATPISVRQPEVSKWGAFLPKPYSKTLQPLKRFSQFFRNPLKTPAKSSSELSSQLKPTISETPNSSPSHSPLSSSPSPSSPSPSPTSSYLSPQYSPSPSSILQSPISSEESSPSLSAIHSVEHSAAHSAAHSMEHSATHSVEHSAAHSSAHSEIQSTASSPTPSAILSDPLSDVPSVTLRVTQSAELSEVPPVTQSGELYEVSHVTQSEELSEIPPATLSEELSEVPHATLSEELSEELPEELPATLSEVPPAELSEELSEVQPATLSKELSEVPPATLSESPNVTQPKVQPEALFVTQSVALSEPKSVESFEELSARPTVAMSETQSLKLWEVPSIAPTLESLVVLPVAPFVEPSLDSFVEQPTEASVTPSEAPFVEPSLNSSVEEPTEASVTPSEAPFVTPSAAVPLLESPPSQTLFSSPLTPLRTPSPMQSETEISLLTDSPPSPTLLSSTPSPFLASSPPTTPTESTSTSSSISAHTTLSSYSRAAPPTASVQGDNHSVNGNFTIISQNSNHIVQHLSDDMYKTMKQSIKRGRVKELQKIFSTCIYDKEDLHQNTSHYRNGGEISDTYWAHTVETKPVGYINPVESNFKQTSLRAQNNQNAEQHEEEREVEAEEETKEEKLYRDELQQIEQTHITENSFVNMDMASISLSSTSNNTIQSGDYIYKVEPTIPTNISDTSFNMIEPEEVGLVAERLINVNQQQTEQSLSLPSTGFQTTTTSETVFPEQQRSLESMSKINDNIRSENDENSSYGIITTITSNDNTNIDIKNNSNNDHDSSKNDIRGVIETKTDNYVSVKDITEETLEAINNNNIVNNETSNQINYIHDEDANNINNNNNITLGILSTAEEKTESLLYPKVSDEIISTTETDQEFINEIRSNGNEEYTEKDLPLETQSKGESETLEQRIEIQVGEEMNANTELGVEAGTGKSISETSVKPIRREETEMVLRKSSGTKDVEINKEEDLAAWNQNKGTIQEMSQARYLDIPKSTRDYKVRTLIGIWPPISYTEEEKETYNDIDPGMQENETHSMKENDQTNGETVLLNGARTYNQENNETVNTKHIPNVQERLRIVNKHIVHKTNELTPAQESLPSLNTEVVHEVVEVSPPSNIQETLPSLNREIVHEVVEFSPPADIQETLPSRNSEVVHEIVEVVHEVVEVSPPKYIQETLPSLNNEVIHEIVEVSQPADIHEILPSENREVVGEIVEVIPPTDIQETLLSENMEVIHEVVEVSPLSHIQETLPSVDREVVDEVVQVIPLADIQETLPSENSEAVGEIVEVSRPTNITSFTDVSSAREVEYCLETLPPVKCEIVYKTSDSSLFKYLGESITLVKKDVSHDIVPAKDDDGTVIVVNKEVVEKTVEVSQQNNTQELPLSLNEENVHEFTGKCENETMHLVNKDILRSFTAVPTNRNDGNTIVLLGREIEMTPAKEAEENEVTISDSQLKNEEKTLIPINRDSDIEPIELSAAKDVQETVLVEVTGEKSTTNMEDILHPTKKETTQSFVEVISSNDTKTTGEMNKKTEIGRRPSVQERLRIVNSRIVQTRIGNIQAKQKENIICSANNEVIPEPNQIVQGITVDVTNNANVSPLTQSQGLYSMNTESVQDVEEVSPPTEIRKTLPSLNREVVHEVVKVSLPSHIQETLPSENKEVVQEVVEVSLPSHIQETLPSMNTAVVHEVVEVSLPSDIQETLISQNREVVHEVVEVSLLSDIQETLPSVDREVVHEVVEVSPSADIQEPFPAENREVLDEHFEVNSTMNYERGPSSLRKENVQDISEVIPPGDIPSNHEVEVVTAEYSEIVHRTIEVSPAKEIDETNAIPAKRFQERNTKVKGEIVDSVVKQDSVLSRSNEKERTPNARNDDVVVHELADADTLHEEYIGALETVASSTISTLQYRHNEIRVEDETKIFETSRKMDTVGNGEVEDVVEGSASVENVTDSVVKVVTATEHSVGKPLIMSDVEINVPETNGKSEGSNDVKEGIEILYSVRVEESRRIEGEMEAGTGMAVTNEKTLEERDTSKERTSGEVAVTVGVIERDIDEKEKKERQEKDEKENEEVVVVAVEKEEELSEKEEREIEKVVLTEEKKKGDDKEVVEKEVVTSESLVVVDNEDKFSSISTLEVNKVKERDTNLITKEGVPENNNDIYSRSFPSFVQSCASVDTNEIRTIKDIATDITPITTTTTTTPITTAIATSTTDLTKKVFKRSYETRVAVGEDISLVEGEVTILPTTTSEIYSAPLVIAENTQTTTVVCGTYLGDSGDSKEEEGEQEERRELEGEEGHLKEDDSGSNLDCVSHIPDYSTSSEMLTRLIQSPEGNQTPLINGTSDSAAAETTTRITTIKSNGTIFTRPAVTNTVITESRTSVSPEHGTGAGKRLVHELNSVRKTEGGNVGENDSVELAASKESEIRRHFNSEQRERYPGSATVSRSSSSCSSLGSNFLGEFASKNYSEENLKVEPKTTEDKPETEKEKVVTGKPVNLLCRMFESGRSFFGERNIPSGTSSISEQDSNGLLRKHEATKVNKSNDQVTHWTAVTEKEPLISLSSRPTETAGYTNARSGTIVKGNLTGSALEIVRPPENIEFQNRLTDSVDQTNYVHINSKTQPEVNNFSSEKFLSMPDDASYQMNRKAYNTDFAQHKKQPIIEIPSYLYSKTERVTRAQHQPTEEYFIVKNPLVKNDTEYVSPEIQQSSNQMAEVSPLKKYYGTAKDVHMQMNTPVETLPSNDFDKNRNYDQWTVENSSALNTRIRADGVIDYNIMQPLRNKLTDDEMLNSQPNILAQTTHNTFSENSIITHRPNTETGLTTSETYKTPSSRNVEISSPVIVDNFETSEQRQNTLLSPTLNVRENDVDDGSSNAIKEQKISGNVHRKIKAFEIPKAPVMDLNNKPVKLKSRTSLYHNPAESSTEVLYEKVKSELRPIPIKKEVDTEGNSNFIDDSSEESGPTYIPKLDNGLETTVPITPTSYQETLNKTGNHIVDRPDDNDSNHQYKVVSLTPSVTEHNQITNVIYCEINRTQMEPPNSDISNRKKTDISISQYTHPSVASDNVKRHTKKQKTSRITHQFTPNVNNNFEPSDIPEPTVVKKNHSETFIDSGTGTETVSSEGETETVETTTWTEFRLLPLGKDVDHKRRAVLTPSSVSTNLPAKQTITMDYVKKNHSTPISARPTTLETKPSSIDTHKIYEMHNEPESVSASDAEEDLKIVRGKLLIKNVIDSPKDGDDFDDNINVFADGFHLDKENPLYQSDQDLSKREDSDAESFEEWNDDITFETVDQLAKTHTSNAIMKKDAQNKQKLTKNLLSRLSNIDSKDIKQSINVEHKHEEIHGDIDFIHADGTKITSNYTDNFDSIAENVELWVKSGKAVIMIKVIAERIIPIDYEFSVWRKSSAIVTRQIELDLQANEQRQRLYAHVMKRHGKTGAGYQITEKQYEKDTEGHEKTLNSRDTFKLFNQLLNVAEDSKEGGDQDERYTEKTERLALQRPTTNDFMY